MTESFEYNQTHNPLNPRVVLATTASTIGLVSIALIVSIYLAIILGGIAIVLAILSRGEDGKFLPQAKKAIGFGSVAIVISYILLVNSAISYFTDPELRKSVNKFSESISGESFDDTLNELGESLGISFK